MITKPHLKPCERMYTIDFSLFLEIESLQCRYVRLNALNCKLVANILQTFCLANVGMTSDFCGSELPKVKRLHQLYSNYNAYEGYFQQIYNLVHLIFTVKTWGRRLVPLLLWKPQKWKSSKDRRSFDGLTRSPTLNWLGSDWGAGIVFALRHDQHIESHFGWIKYSYHVELKTKITFLFTNTANCGKKEVESFPV